MTSVVEFPKPKLVEPPTPQIEEAFIKALEMTLEEAKQGRISAAAVISVTPDGSVGNWYYDDGMVYFHELVSGATFLVRRLQDELGEWAAENEG